mgnify:CR=1 FL=1
MDTKILGKTKSNHHKNPAFAISEIGLVHSLGISGIPVYHGFYSSRNVASYSRYTKRKFKLPGYDSEDFIEKLCEIGKDFEERPTLYSDNDQTLLKISSERERLLPYYNFFLPEHDLVNKILDKNLFVELCEEYDLPAPVSFSISSDHGLEEYINDIPYPCIVKPKFKENWWNTDLENIMGGYKKAFVCNDETELKSVVEKISTVSPNIVVQEYIKGPDRQMYDVNLMVTPDKEIKSYVIAKKLRVHPPGAGYGCYVETVHNDEVLELCKRIIKKLDLPGMLNIQFKQDIETKKYGLIEIHPRTSIFDILGAASGQNIPALYHMYLKQSSLPQQSSYKDDVKYLELKRDLKLFLGSRSNYDASAFQWLKSYLDVSVIAGLRLTDLRPFIFDIWFMLKRWTSKI